MRKNELVFGLCLCLPWTQAHAYIDPDIVNVLYQILYVTVFGAIVGWVARPWDYLRSLYRRLTGRVDPATSLTDEEEKGRMGPPA